MSDEETPKFICQQCGAEFDIDPECVFELLMGGDGNQFMSPEMAREFEESGIGWTKDTLENMNEYQLSEIDLTPEQRDALLNGEEITVGSIILCPDCLNELEQESTTN